MNSGREREGGKGIRREKSEKEREKGKVWLRGMTGRSEGNERLGE